MLTIGAADKNKCLGGAWFDGDNGQRFLVARQDNANYMRARERLRRPHRKKFEQGKGDEVAFEIALRATAEAILLGWEGVKNVDGDAVPYTPELGYQALEESPEFREMIATWSQEEAAYYRDSVEKQ